MNPQNSMVPSSGLTMEQKHIALATGSFLLGGLAMWFWMRPKAR